jgi:hypothetical protein
LFYLETRGLTNLFRPNHLPRQRLETRLAQPLFLLSGVIFMIARFDGFLPSLRARIDIDA